MYTHCPHCDTCFRVTSEQLKAARGSVRCGRCFGTFNALEHLVDEAPQPELQPPALTPATPKKPPLAPRPALPAKSATPSATPTLQAAAPAPSRPTAPLQAPAPSRPTAPPAALLTPVATAAVPPPSPPPRREPQVEHAQLLVEEIGALPIMAAHRHLWLWLLLTPLLILVFLIQYAWFNLATLSQQPQLRPALETLCAIAKCEVPLIKAPYMITLVERDIRNHPGRSGVLQVKARIINKAPYPQAYPLMELSLHDITGHIIATRRFGPDEYLPPNINQKPGIAPQQMVDILLELADPGKEAVGFEFEFL